MTAAKGYWPRVPLKAVANVLVSHVDKKAVHGELPIRLCNYVDVYYNETITSGLAFMEATANARDRAVFGLQGGDVLITKDSETAEDIAQAAYVPETLHDVVCGYHLAILRPRHTSSVCGRYLFWAIKSAEVRGYLASAASGVTRFGLRQAALASVSIPVPSLPEQRGIADYLDRETARIDALLMATRQMADLLEERWQGVLETSIRTLVDCHDQIPLKYACREIVVGIVVTPSAWYAEVGVPALRGVNVRPGHIILDDLVYLTKEGDALHAKSRLNTGDVIIVRTGQAGTAAVVPADLDGANCIDLVIIRPGPDLDPHFLEFVLNSDWLQKHIDEHSVGSIQSHFNVGAAKSVPIPRVPLDEQARVVQELRAERDHAQAVIDRLQHRMRILGERRQSLIAAAIAGQVDVAGEVA